MSPSGPTKHARRRRLVRVVRWRGRRRWRRAAAWWRLRVERGLALGRGLSLGGKAAAALVALVVMSLAAWRPLPGGDPSPDIASTDAAGRAVEVKHSEGGRVQRADARTTRGTIEALAVEGHAELLKLHLATLAADGGATLYRDNAVELLVDGPKAMSSMARAIAAAKREVLLQTFIFEGTGEAADVADALVARARAGLPVALLVDAVGVRDTPPEDFERLEAAGVILCHFNPTNPAKAREGWSPNHRSHRKVLVVDGRLGFTGGMNISEVYGSGSAGDDAGRADRADAAGEAPRRNWRDTHVRVRGPVVDALRASFQADWQGQSCPALREGVGLPMQPVDAGDRVVKVLATSPDEPNRFYATLLRAIEVSRRSVQITNAYFAPGPDLIESLAQAAQRGVKVSVLLPGVSDADVLVDAARSHYATMLEAGVEIHEVRHTVLHAKTAVIDGVLSLVGSSNLDFRSLALNDELTLAVLGHEFGTQLEQVFDDDLTQAVPIDASTWPSRPWWDRIQQWMARLAERWL